MICFLKWWLMTVVLYDEQGWFETQMFIKFTWHKAKHRGLKYWWYNKDKAIDFFSYCSNDLLFEFAEEKMMVEVSSEATRGIIMIDFSK